MLPSICATSPVLLREFSPPNITHGVKVKLYNIQEVMSLSSPHLARKHSLELETCESGFVVFIIFVLQPHTQLFDCGLLSF